MDTFLFHSNYLIFYQWFKSQLPGYFTEDCNKWCSSLSQDNQDYQICISFYGNGVVEELVKDTKEDSVLYYLHFHFSNFLQSSTICYDFLTYLKSLNKIRKHVLICCSCGMTSSLFAEDLQKYSDDHKININVSASDIHTLQDKYKDYDLILLTPQVGYYKPQLVNKVTTQIVTIPTTDYACHHFPHVLSLIQHYI